MEGDASPTKFTKNGANISLQAVKYIAILDRSNLGFFELETIASKECKEQNSEDRGRQGSRDTRHLVRLNFVRARGAGWWRAESQQLA
jgi:hypothetical protein